MTVSASELQFILRMQDSMSAELKPVIEQLQRMSQAAVNSMDSLRNLEASASGGFAKTASGAAAATSSLNSLRTAAYEVGAAFVAFRAGDAAIEATLGNFSKFEQVGLSVEKFTSMGANDLKVFGQAFQDMASRIPLPTEELGKMAAMASSIGVKGAENIVHFTEAAAKLAIVSNITGDALVKVIAQSLAIFNEGSEGAEKFVSTLAVLDNMTANTGKNVAQLELRVAQGTSPWQIGTQAALTWAAAIANSGIAAERGGTAVQRLFLSLDNMLTGIIPHAAKVQADVGHLMGETLSQMKADFFSNPNDFAVKFIDTLGKVKVAGDGTNGLLKEMGLSALLSGSALQTLAADYQHFDAAQQAASAEQHAAISRANIEMAVFAGGLQQHMQLLKNNAEVLGNTIGAVMAPTAKSGIDTLITAIQGANTAFKNLDPETQKITAAVLTFGTTAAGAAIGVGVLVAAIGLIGPEALAIGAVVSAMGLLGVKIAEYNGLLQTTVQLGPQEVELLDSIATSANQAASEIDKMTEAQKKQLEETAKSKADEVTAQYQKLTEQLKQFGLDQQQVFDVSTGGWVDASAQMSIYMREWQQLVQDVANGKISVDEYNRATKELETQDSTIKGQADTVAGLISKWAAAADEVLKYGTAVNRLGGVNVPSKPYGGGEFDMNLISPQKPKPTGLGVAPPTGLGGGGGGGAGRAESLRDFLEETQQKIQAYKDETDAAQMGTQAFKEAQKVAADNKDTLAIEDRARKLGMAADAAHKLAEEYKAARVASEQAAATDKWIDAVTQLNKDEAAMQKIIDVAAVGKDALAEFKKGLQLDKEWESFQKLATAAGKTNEEIAALKDKFMALKAAEVDAVEHAGSNFFGGLNDALTDISKKVNDTGSAIKSVFEDSFSHAEDAFTKFVETGKFNFSDLEKSVESDLIKLSEKILIEQPLMNLFGMGGSGNVFTTLFGNGFGGTQTNGTVIPGSTTGGGGTSSLAGTGSSIFGSALSALGKLGSGSFSGIGDAISSAYAGSFLQSVFNPSDFAAVTAAASAAASGTNFLGAALPDVLAAHSGWWVGMTPAPQRIRGVDPSVFHNAPRFHTGLNDDEFPTILQKSERVLTADQNATVGGILKSTANGGGQAQRPVTHIHNWNFPPGTNPDTFMRSQGQIAAAAARTMTRTANKFGTRG